MGRPARDRQIEERIKQWLEAWRLRANPFAQRYADGEADLPAYFLPTVYYEALRGSCQTSLVIADSGGGKTAHRLMLAGAALPRDPRSDVLAVEYVEFAALLPESPDEPATVPARRHVAHILALATQALLESMLRRTRQALGLPGEWLALLTWFCREYRPPLAGPVEAIRRMRQIAGPERGARLLWDDFQRAVEQRRTRAYLDGLGLDDAGCLLLANLLDAVPAPPPAGLAPAEVLRLFVTLLPPLGIRCLHVLIDGLEDAERLRADPADLVDFVYPLLADLTLMLLPGVSFTFFLPRAARAELERRDDRRLLERLPCHEIVWDDAMLRDLLAQRLAHYRDPASPITLTLPALCAPGLAATVERDLLEFADGSPRRALALCDDLLLAHCSQPDSDQQFDAEDWARVLEWTYGLTTRSGYPLPRHPPLRIDRQTRQVFVGRREVELPAALYDFLLVFYEHPYRWLTWSEVDALMDVTVTYDSFRQNLARLRKAIEPGSRPVYLLTRRERGARLENVWLGPE